jgi:hypothetical protein
MVRYVIALISWTLLALLALAASRPAPIHTAPLIVERNWSFASQGFPAYGDIGPLH